jgi:alkylhydroperoxidase/carboxymuconolactone decarboxylase family protein YurZ
VIARLLRAESAMYEKKLIAMAIGLGHRCTQSINPHMQGCVKAGATREPILEAAGVGHHDARRTCAFTRRA